jgi:hypothetical protein
LKICCIGNGGTAGEFVCVSQIIYQVIIHLHRLTEKIGQPLIKVPPEDDVKPNFRTPLMVFHVRRGAASKDI